MNRIHNYLLSILILFLFFSCSDEEMADPAEYLIFGHFYGFCLGDQCIQIYKLESNRLFIDTNQDYPKHNEFYDASFQELENNYYEPVKDLLDYFPTRILSESDTVFGCPDCADGGGLYIEYKTKDIRRYWIIDQDNRQVPVYLHEFIEQVNNKIETINSIKNQ